MTQILDGFSLVLFRKIAFQKLELAQRQRSLDTKEISLLLVNHITMNSAEPDGTVFIFASESQKDPGCSRSNRDVYQYADSNTLKAGRYSRAL